MQRPPFNIDRRAAVIFRALIAQRAVVTSLRGSRPLLTRDPDDDMVLKTAIAGKAELLVTSNTDDFEEIAKPPGGTSDLTYRGIRVVGVGTCLAAIRAEHAEATREMRRKRRWP